MITLTRSYINLAAEVAKFDTGAARYMLTGAPKLPSFGVFIRDNPHAENNIESWFAWDETPDGPFYWAELSNILLDLDVSVPWEPGKPRV